MLLYFLPTKVMYFKSGSNGCVSFRLLISPAFQPDGSVLRKYFSIHPETIRPFLLRCFLHLVTSAVLAANNKEIMNRDALTV